MAKYWFQEADTYAKVAELGDLVQLNAYYDHFSDGSGSVCSLTPDRMGYLEDSDDPNDPEKEFIEYDIYQYFFLDDNLAELLLQYSDEIVFYDSNTECYIWGITHFGTSWTIVPFTWHDEKQTDYYLPWDVA